MTSEAGIEVRSAAPDELTKPLKLLEEFLRGGEPVQHPFAGQLALAVEGGNLEVLVALAGRQPVGVAVLAFRLNVSVGSLFASIECLYVRPDARRRGVGRALLEAVGERCRTRGVSYVEVQTDDEAERFYRAMEYEREVGIQVLSRAYVF